MYLLHDICCAQRGMAQLPDLHVSDSSEAMLSGRKPPFRLLVRAVHTEGRRLAIRHAVSEGFVVSIGSSSKADMRLLSRPGVWQSGLVVQFGAVFQRQLHVLFPSCPGACAEHPVVQSSVNSHRMRCRCCQSAGGDAAHEDGGQGRDPQCGRPCIQAGAHGQGDRQKAAGHPRRRHWFWHRHQRPHQLHQQGCARYIECDHMQVVQHFQPVQSNLSP